MLQLYNQTFNELFITYMPYIFIVLVFFVVILYLYFKYKHKHWLKQPIHNKYDPRLWGKNGVITNQVVYNKYFKPMCYSSEWSKVIAEKKALLKFFLVSHFNYYKTLPISLTIENLNSYLIKHNNKCYVTIHYKDSVKQNKIIGSIVSKPIEGRFYNKDLKVDDPYNTYKYKGLPPGPINNPGLAALKAAMNPAETKYLYFVSNLEGRHTFTHTADEHNQAKLKMKEKRRSKRKL